MPPLRRALVGRSILQHLYHFILSKVEATSVDVPYSSRTYRSDDEKSFLNQKETTRVPLQTKRSVEVGDCSEYTRVPTLRLGCTPPRTLYLLRVLYIPVCRDNAYYRVETKGEPGEESQQMKRVNELRSPGDLIVFPRTLARQNTYLTLQLTTSPSPSPSSDCDIHSTSPRHQSPTHSPSYAPPLDSPKTRPTPQNPPACPLSHSAAQRPTYPTHSPCQTPSFARETLQDKYNSL